MIAMVLFAAGLSILGKPVPEWPSKAPEKWVQGGPLTLAGLRGKVVLLRFFMDADCPLCRGTAPALIEFHREFSTRGLVVVGMYTPKPRPRAVPTEVVRQYVDAYGFEFPVAVDDDWSALRRLWLDRVPDTDYTSASLLIDRDGILRHVHEGGLFSKEVLDPEARRGYKEMRAAIEKLLAEP